MHLGLGIYLSNAMGYVVGIVFSFIANTIFTFTQPISINRLIKFYVFASFVMWQISLS
ncbi:GtrA family protein [Klebsiella pneumoniae]|nr:GtrA family protein [Klebsiella pneumoniae]